MKSVFRWLRKAWSAAIGWYWSELKREASNWWQFIQDKIAIVTLLLLLFLLFELGQMASEMWARRDNDPERGAAAVAHDRMGDRSERIVYLDEDFEGQGWSPSDTLWFDDTPIGSDLIPYDFFLVLKAPNGELLRSNENLNNRYRFLVRKPTSSNPDGLPVGLVEDHFKARAFAGFTCAACHTAEIDYHGTGMRIDGAPAMVDIDSFLTDLGAALRRVQAPGPVHDGFVKDVLALGDYQTAEDVERDLKIYALKLTAYRVVNKSDTRYGFARLDSVGRMYNQVLEYVTDVRSVERVLNELVWEHRLSDVDIDKGGSRSIRATLKELERKSELNGGDRDRLVETLVANLSLKQVLYFRNKLFNPPDAPASYPALWDTRQYDVAQWTGSSSTENDGPVDRDIAETLGLFATLNWSRGDHWTLAGATSGQGLSTHPSTFESSIRVENLKKIETQLKYLRSPRWPEEVLGRLDSVKAERGALLFERYCASCHETIDRTAPDRAGHAYKMKLSDIATDPQLATSSADNAGLSGFLADQYVSVGKERMWIGRTAPVSLLTGQVAVRVFSEPDPDAWWFSRLARQAPDYLAKNLGSAVGLSGEEPGNVGAFSADLFYKARSLNGIWATAPYLHNGSIPNLYSLLLPASPQPGDPPDAKYRPKEFMVGSREFDPVNVGLKSDGYDGFVFLTNALGNSNAGHEFGTRDGGDANGEVIVSANGTPALPALTDPQRWDLIEYLKTL